MAQRRERPSMAYVWFVAFLLALSLSYIVAFKLLFGYRRMVIPLHLMLMTGFYGVIGLGLGGLVAVCRSRGRRLARSLVAAVHVVSFTLVSLLYLIDFVGNRTWGANVTAKVIGSYVFQFHSLFAALPFSPIWIYGASVVFLVAVIGLHAAISRRLVAGLEELFLPGRTLSLFGTRRRTVLSVLVLTIAAAVFAGFMWRSLHWRGQFWHGEPIVGLFKTNPLFVDDPRNVGIAQEAQRVRAEYPKGLAFDRRNVVIIMADSLRAAHMQVCGYERPTTPFLQGLSDVGRLRHVRMAVSSGSETSCGILTTLSSRDYVDLSYYNFKVYDLLQDLEYRAYFICSGDHTNWHGYRDNLGRHMDLFFDGGSSQRYSINDDRLVLEGFDRVPDYDGQPAFFFIFLMSTHEIGVKLDEYDRYQPSKISGKDPWALGEAEYDRQVLTNRYDNGVIQADAMIERVFKALDQKGYLRDCVAIITADHGEGLGERGNYLHCTHLYQEDIGIPILIYDDPGVAYANLEFGAQIDLAPTIVDRLGLPIPSCWEGRSLLRADIKTYSFHTTLGIWPRRAVIYRTGSAVYKYIRTHPDDRDPTKEELYDLVADPQERTNLVSVADPELLRQLRGKANAEFGADRD